MGAWPWALILLVALILALDGDKPQPGTHFIPSPLGPPGHGLGGLWHVLPLLCFTSQCPEDGKQGFLRGPVLWRQNTGSQPSLHLPFLFSRAPLTSLPFLLVSWVRVGVMGLNISAEKEPSHLFRASIPHLPHDWLYRTIRPEPGMVARPTRVLEPAPSQTLNNGPVFSFEARRSILIITSY